MPVVLKRKINDKLKALRGGGNQRAPQAAGQQGLTMGNEPHARRPYGGVQNVGGSQLKPQKYSNPGLEKQLKQCLEELYKAILGRDNLVKTLKIMDKLLGNVVKDQNNQQFRVIKLDNKTIANRIGKYRPAVEFFNLLRFLPYGQNVLKLEGQQVENLQDIQLALETLHSFGNKFGQAVNNIGKSFVNSKFGKTNLDVAKANASDIGNIFDQLNRLKAQRNVSLITSTN